MNIRGKKAMKTNKLTPWRDPFEHFYNGSRIGLIRNEKFDTFCWVEQQKPLNINILAFFGAGYQLICDPTGTRTQIIRTGI